MGRYAVALGLAIVAGCGGDTGMSPLWETYTVKVSNEGTEPLNGTIQDWDKAVTYDFTLQPGDKNSFDFVDPYRVRLHAWRTSDGMLLIDDFWELGDLADGVKVTLTP